MGYAPYLIYALVPACEEYVVDRFLLERKELKLKQASLVSKATNTINDDGVKESQRKLVKLRISACVKGTPSLSQRRA